MDIFKWKSFRQMFCLMAVFQKYKKFSGLPVLQTDDVICCGLVKRNAV